MKTAWLLLAITVLPATARAQWVTDGISVAVAEGRQWEVRGAKDGEGGAFLVWQDERSSPNQWDIYLTRILADGTTAPGWPANGMIVCNAAKTQGWPVVIADGAGGVLIGWEDERGASRDIYAQRIGADGSIAPGWPLNGLPICVAPNRQQLVELARDGGDGVFIAWEDWRATNHLIHAFATHVLGTGAFAAGWPVNGLPLGDVGNNQFMPKLLADGAGGVFAAWNDTRTDPYDVAVQHLLADATVAPGWPASGRLFASGPGYQLNPLLLADGGGGAFIAWSVLGTDFTSTYDAYLGHMLSDGSPDPAWPSGGLAVAATERQQIPYSLIASGSGCIVGWFDEVFSSTPLDADVYAQRVGGDGVIDSAWPAGGLAVASEPLGEVPILLAPDGAGGAWATWEDSNPDTIRHVSVAHMRANGTFDPGFPGDGTRLAGTGGDQFGIDIVADDAGGAIVAWTDNRLPFPVGTSPGDLFAQRVPFDHVTAVEAPSGGVRLAVRTVSPTGATRPRIDCTILPGPPAQLEVFDILGRRLDRHEVTASGSLEIGTATRLPAGVYMLRLRQGNHAAFARAVCLK